MRRFGLLMLLVLLAGVGMAQAPAQAQVTENELAAQPLDSFFTVSALPDSLFALMQGRSYPKGCTMKRDSLRYLSVLHRDEHGRAMKGQLVCHKRIAHRLRAIFIALFKSNFPIHSLQLIDHYGADDNRSMRANNSSCFCFRTVAGQRRLSKHAQGLAIDLNPLWNPCVKGNRVEPQEGRRYASRSAKMKGKMAAGDAVVKLFQSHGARWGGHWKSKKDYQHFEW